MSNIQYVNGGTNATSIAGTSLTLTYSPTSGNEIVCGIYTSANITGLGCADNNGNGLTPSPYNPQNRASLFFGTAVSGATSYTFSWTGNSGAVCALVEYANVVGIGSGGGTASGSSNLPTISNTTTAVNSVIVAFVLETVGTTFSQNTGNLRQKDTDTQITATVGLNDNTASSVGSSVTNAISAVSSNSWYIISLEMYPAPPIVSAGFGEEYQFSFDDSCF